MSKELFCKVFFIVGLMVAAVAFMQGYQHDRLSEYNRQMLQEARDNRAAEAAEIQQQIDEARRTLAKAEKRMAKFEQSLTR